MSDEGAGGLTLGERIRKIEDDIAASRSHLAELLSRDRADYVHIETLKARVTAVEDWQRWALRVVVGAVLLGLLAYAGWG